MTLKVKFLHFLTAFHYSNFPNLVISLQSIFSQKPFQFCIPPLKTPQLLMPYCTWFFPENTSFDCANIIPKVSRFLDNWFSLLHYLFSKMHTILGKLITHIIAVLNLSFAVHNCFDKRGTYCLLQYLNWFYNYYTLLSSKWLQ